MRQALSPPNLLTFARIAMTPFIVAALLGGDCSRALALSLIAGATDAADGFLARRFGWNTRFGAYLDPIADKLLLTSLYVCFGLLRVVPNWLVWLVVGRDALILLLTAGGMILTGRRDYPPTVWGKISTFIQIGASLVFLAQCGSPGARLAEVSIWAVAVATAWSGIHYLGRAVRWSRERGTALPEAPRR